MLVPRAARGPRVTRRRRSGVPDRVVAPVPAEQSDEGWDMRTSTTVRLLAAVLGLGLALTACGGPAGAPEAVTGLRYVVPNTPGSGYDLTARTAAKTMQDAGLARNVEVFHVPGAGGTVACSGPWTSGATAS